jgi:RNA polymerase sigma factor (TIGR02999 family)
MAPETPPARSFDELVERLYADLKTLAIRVRWQGPVATQPTSLLNEAYMRLRSCRGIETKPKEEVLTIFAHVMRNIMVDAARKVRSRKRGGGATPVALDTAHAPVVSPDVSADVLTVDAALALLQEQNPRQASTVEMRYFLGLTVAEIALVSDMGVSTVERDWREGMKFLRAKMRG